MHTNNNTMLVGIKFREKGEKEYISVIIAASSLDEAYKTFKKTFVDSRSSYSYDVDRRTISWAGSSIPLTYTDPIVIYADIDKLM